MDTKRNGYQKITVPSNKIIIFSGLNYSQHSKENSQAHMTSHFFTQNDHSIYINWAKLSPQGFDTGWEFSQANPLASMQKTPLTPPLQTKMSYNFKDKLYKTSYFA